MKPYQLITEEKSNTGATISLNERDGVFFLQSDSFPIVSSKEIFADERMAETLAQPFRPVKQPKVLVLGLGIGAATKELSKILLQKKGTFEILDPNPKALEWYKEYFSDQDSGENRFEFVNADWADWVGKKHAQYNIVLMDPEYWRAFDSSNSAELTTTKNLSLIANCVKGGGLLGFTTDRVPDGLKNRLQKRGFETTYERIQMVDGGKRQRTVWICKKGHFTSQHS